VGFPRRFRPIRLAGPGPTYFIIKANTHQLSQNVLPPIAPPPPTLLAPGQLAVKFLSRELRTLLPVLRIRDVYPGSWISDPKTATNERDEKKLVVIPFLVATNFTNFTKFKIILFLNC
jgi:hypothetical protein